MPANEVLLCATLTFHKYPNRCVEKSLIVASLFYICLRLFRPLDFSAMHQISQSIPILAFEQLTPTGSIPYNPPILSILTIGR